MSDRFSKLTLARHCFTNIQYLNQKYRFTTDNGYAQVEGKSAEINRAYGKWETLHGLVDIYNLWDLHESAMTDPGVKPAKVG